MPELLLTRTTLVGLLLAESKLPRLPAESWPLEAAIEALASDPRAGSLTKAAGRWLAPSPSARGRIDGVGRWARERCEDGLLRPEGEGWSAGYRPEGEWLASAAALREELGEDERLALAAAAQCLVAMASMLSKNAAA
jgi:hypothetical protein